MRGGARLRICTSAGEALPESVGNAWKARFGVDILDGVGSTELLHIFLSNAPGDIKYGTSGRPVPGYQVRLVNEAGADVADGEVGEMLVHAPSAGEGYWNQRSKSRSTFEGYWTRTGDKYVRDADGRYTFCGRSDDMFKVSGIWVSPFEVESALITHPAVLEAAVVPEADPEGLLKPKAYVVLRADAKTDGLHEALKDYVKQKIGVWKYPRWIDVVESLAENRDRQDPAVQAAGRGVAVPSACLVERWFPRDAAAIPCSPPLQHRAQVARGHRRRDSDGIMTLAPTGFLRIGACRSRIPHDRPCRPPTRRPSSCCMKGLGSAGLWGDFPDKLQAATGAGVFVYSRAGYGASTPVKLPRPLDYMQIEALEVLPKLLDQIGFRRGLLLGHSDGASIAAIYAGGVADHRVRGVALIAPHFVVEDISVASIAEIKNAYETTGLQAKAGALARRCRQRLLRLERRLARPEVSRLGYFGIPRLYPRPGRDPAGRRRPVWDNPPDRDRQGGVLLSGRCDDHCRGRDIRRIAKRRRRRCMRSRILLDAFCDVHEGSQGRAA